MTVAGLLTLAMFSGLIWAQTSPEAIRTGQPRTVQHLMWSDEFEGPAKSAPDRTKWTFDLGQTGWGNQELENYTNSTDNAFLDGEGHLVIQAIAEPGGKYTSARLKTQGLAAFTYGRIEARIQVPFGQGIWPAFWMLGADITSAGWPRCGEIDIMENIGKEPTIVHGTVHGPGYSGGNGIGAAYSLPGGQAFSADFHVYAVEWDQATIEFQVDGHVYKRVTPAELPAGTQWVYGHPFFLLLNLAVGGNWPGYPDATTKFPQRMLVDYVRVYEKSLPTGR
jgi:beta-glucanase (GH16 family)